MPTTFEIPRHQEHRCEPCQYHHCFSAFYGSNHSWRDYNCMHPEAHEFEPLSTDSAIAAKQGELRAMINEHGRHIGKTEMQPTWCPLLRQLT